MFIGSNYQLDPMEIPTHAQLIEEVDAFLARHSMAESRLGREATGEPGLVARIRDGRNVTLDTLNRLAAYMAEQDAKAAAEAAAAQPGKSSDLTAETTGPKSGGVVCGVCDLRAADPAVAACIAPDCGLRAQEMAA